MNKRSPEYHPSTHIYTHICIHKKKKQKRKTKKKIQQQQQKQKSNTTTTNLTTGYTLCDVNTEDTVRHNIALMTSTSRVYIPYPLGTIIK